MSPGSRWPEATWRLHLRNLRFPANALALTPCAPALPLPKPGATQSTASVPARYPLPVYILRRPSDLPYPPPPFLPPPPPLLPNSTAIHKASSLNLALSSFSSRRRHFLASLCCIARRRFSLSPLLHCRLGRHSPHFRDNHRLSCHICDLSFRCFPSALVLAPALDSVVAFLSRLGRRPPATSWIGHRPRCRRCPIGLIHDPRRQRLSSSRSRRGGDVGQPQGTGSLVP